MPTIHRLAVDDAVAELLRKALKLEGFFPEFKAEHAEKLFIHGGLFLYPEGSHVLDQQEPGKDLFVVHSGVLAVLRREGGADRRLAELRAGDIFGEIALLRDGTRSATVLVEEEARVFRVACGDIQYLLANNKALGEHLSALAEQRLRS